MKKKVKRLIAFLSVIMICISVSWSDSLSVEAASYPSIMLSNVPYFPQKISGDCGISSIAMIEAYALGYDSSCFDALYDGVYAANGNSLSIGTAVNSGQYTDITKDLATVYSQLQAGNPVLIYRGSSSYHWSVIVGYNGSSTTLEKSGFIVYNTAHGTTVGQPYTSNLSDWLSGNSWLHAKVRNTGAISEITTSVSTLTLQNVCYPSNLKTGSGMGSRGLLISSGVVTSVSAGVRDSSGTVKFSASATPQSKYFTLLNLDSSMKFSSLSAGTYTYYVTASDSTGAALSWEQSFAVSSSATALKTTTFTGTEGGSVQSSIFSSVYAESITATDAVMGAGFDTTRYVTTGGLYFGTDPSNMTKISETLNCNAKKIYYNASKWIGTLNSNTTYFYKVFAVIDGTEYVTDLQSFQTTSMFSDTSVTSITETNAVMKATLNDTSYVTTIGVYFGTDPTNLQQITESANCNAKYISYDANKWIGTLHPGTTYYYQIYAYIDGVEHRADMAQFMTLDQSNPVISDVEVLDVTASGYTVRCKVSDNGYVQRVCFPTWTDYNGQDDLDGSWYENEAVYAADSSGYYSYRVNISAHNYESGTYSTHIYAYDTVGNYSSAATQCGVYPLTGISLSQSSVQLEKGASTTLSVTYNPTNTTETKTVTWTTSNSSVATVNSSGEVTAVSAGQATITATVAGKTATCTVTVKTASPSPTPTASPSPSPTPTASPSPTPTPSPTASPSPEPTASPSPEPAASPSTEPTTSPSSTPTASPSPAPTETPSPTPTATPTSTEAPADTPEAQVEAFVERMYTVALGRGSDPEGIAYWSEQLLTFEIDGAGLSRGFILSEEFVDNNYNDAEYIKILYKTFFNREADEGGLEFWMQSLNDGKTRAYVLAGFVNSNEFDELCTAYGISRGILREDGSSINQGIYRFAKRLYTTVFERTADKDGVEYWALQIADGACTPEAAAQGFFWSDEYVAKQTSDEKYIKTLYLTFMDREADDAGLEYWESVLDSGISRQEVLSGFAHSQEFKEIMTEYGL